jgi:hypothetical protein
MMTYQNVLPSTLARSVGYWTGFGKMPSSPAREKLWGDTVSPQLLKMASRRLKPVQYPTERARIDGRTSWETNKGYSMSPSRFVGVFYCQKQ